MSKAVMALIITAFIFVVGGCICMVVDGPDKIWRFLFILSFLCCQIAGNISRSPTDEACKQNCINDELRQRIKNYVYKFSKYMEWRYLDKMVENYNKGINDISANEYQEKALRTAGEPNIENGLMGLCGESGECIDILKKATFQGHELDKEKLKEELGDVAWYLAISAEALGFKLSDIFESNIEKLKKRYPDGFSAEKSINREE